MTRPSYGLTTVPGPLFLLLTVVLVAATFFGTYAWQHRQVTALKGQTNSLSTQLASANKQIASLTTQLTSACQPAAQPSPTPAAPSCTSYRYSSPKGVVIEVFVPAKNAKVSSPVAVIGEVPGNWSFEAQFPVQLKDASGNTVAEGPAHLLGDWMTSQLVPFSVQLTYSKTVSGAGTLVLQKDNPSGLPANADAVSLPVQF